MSEIPKLIHACWFGSGIPKQIEENIQAWKKVLPDWSIHIYTDQDKHLFNDFAHQAWEQKKFAFSADYVRCKMLDKFGGVALNANTIVCKSFDTILRNDNPDFFTGWECFERRFAPFVAVFGSKKNSFIIRSILHEYENENFLTNNSTMLNLSTINERFSRLLNQIDPSLPHKSKYKTTNIGGKSLVYPVNYFCVEDGETNFCISPFNGSWVSHGRTKPIATISVGTKIYQIKKFKPNKNFKHPQKPDCLTHEKVLLNIKNRILISKFSPLKTTPK